MSAARDRIRALVALDQAIKAASREYHRLMRSEAQDRHVEQGAVTLALAVNAGVQSINPEAFRERNAT